MEYNIYNVSGERTPIVGSVSIKFKIDNITRQVDALMLEGSPLEELIVGWKKLTC